ncbi:MAG: AraC family transcriptional regulator [Oscillospiraceae bacterium]|nr:AraC family transcriptional regulator [Oscillospiraceae bacterium]
MIHDAPTNSFHRLSYYVDGDYLSEYLQIERIGRGFIPAAENPWNGLTRGDINTYVFQYTISGTGTLRIGKTVTKINPGQAFAVIIPSNHEYYLDSRDEKWEILYIILRGEWARHLFQKIIGSIGHVLDIAESSRLIQLLEDMYKRIKQRKVKDVFEASYLAYLFIMEFYRVSLDIIPETYPALVRRALEIIRSEYSRLDIEALACELKVSKAHLIRTFSRQIGMPPGQYLIRTRLKHAITLLLSSNRSLDEIASVVGVASGNYLGKMLRRHLGMSTDEYRRKQSITPIHKLADIMDEERDYT